MGEDAHYCTDGGEDDGPGMAGEQVLSQVRLQATPGASSLKVCSTWAKVARERTLNLYL